MHIFIHSFSNVEVWTRGEDKSRIIALLTHKIWIVYFFYKYWVYVAVGRFIVYDGIMSSEGSALEKARFMAYAYFKFPVHKFQMLKAMKIHYEGKVKKPII